MVLLVDGRKKKWAAVCFFFFLFLQEVNQKQEYFAKIAKKKQDETDFFLTKKQKKKKSAAEGGRIFLKPFFDQNRIKMQNFRIFAQKAGWNQKKYPKKKQFQSWKSSKKKHKQTELRILTIWSSSYKKTPAQPKILGFRKKTILRRFGRFYYFCFFFISHLKKYRIRSIVCWLMCYCNSFVCRSMGQSSMWLAS